MTILVSLESVAAIRVTILHSATKLRSSIPASLMHRSRKKDFLGVGAGFTHKHHGAMGVRNDSNPTTLLQLASRDAIDDSLLLSRANGNDFNPSTLHRKLVSDGDDKVGLQAARRYF